MSFDNGNSALEHFLKLSITALTSVPLSISLGYAISTMLAISSAFLSTLTPWIFEISNPEPRKRVVHGVDFYVPALPHQFPHHLIDDREIFGPIFGIREEGGIFQRHHRIEHDRLRPAMMA
jgi:hypothetical protein